MKKCLLSLALLSTIFNLTACIPAAFVAGASGGGAIIYDRRDMKTIYSDANIAQQVKFKIDENPTMKNNTDINVTSFNRVVLLTGSSTTPALRSRAVALAKTVPGIRRIYNQVKAHGLASLMTGASDGWITTKIKTGMVAERDLRSSQIKVITEKGVVYLMGIVNHHQADMAANVASHVDGVQKVVKIFEYTR
jgi:osmotically-inducible protein OsmY